jgi:hypothetical protein
MRCGVPNFLEYQYRVGGGKTGLVSKPPGFGKCGGSNMSVVSPRDAEVRSLMSKSLLNQQLPI